MNKCHMQITSVSFERNEISENLQLREPGSDGRRNTFTVINGENGTGKSALLRIISDAALGLEISNQYRSRSKNISIKIEGNVARTIALSGTHNDRFPQNSGVELQTRSNKFDLMQFYYYGPKQSGNYTSANKASATTTHSLLSAAKKDSAAFAALTRLLQYMGFDAWLKTSLTPGPRSHRVPPERLERLRSHIAELSSDLFLSPKVSTSVLQTLDHLLVLVEENPQFHRELQKLKFSYTFDPRSGTTTSDNEPPLLDMLSSFQPPRETVIADFIVLGILGASLSVRKNQIEYRLDELSSGEWQLFYSLANLVLNVRDNSLILIDEPENSLHPRWQTEYLGLVRDLIKHAEGCHVIIATHSPLIAASLLPFDGNLVRMSRSDPKGGIQAALDDTAYGWLPGDILRERFEMGSVRPPEITKAVNEALRLIKVSSRPRTELTAAARRVNSLRRHLPTHDPLLPVMDAIVEIAFPDEIRAGPTG